MAWATSSIHSERHELGAHTVNTSDPYGQILSWWYARRYAPIIQSSKHRIPRLRLRTNDVVMGAEITRTLHEVLFSIDLMEALSTHKSSEKFAFETLRQMWNENLGRLERSLPEDEAKKLVGSILDKPRVTKKALKITTEANLQLYPPEQLVQLVKQREPGNWVPPEAPSQPRQQPSDPPPRSQTVPQLEGTYYEVLGVTMAATQDEIKAKFRVLALEHHPDRNVHGDRARSERVMSSITEAYDVLSNPDLRARYDQALRPPATARQKEQAFRPPPPDACMICGHGPVAIVTLRSETGLLLARRRSRIGGPLCRHCGIAMFRTVQNKTLITGWWGFISFFANIGSVLANIGAYFELRSLSEPDPIEHRYTTPSRSPIHPGRPLWFRSGIWIAAAAIIIATIIATNHNSNFAASSSRGASTSTGASQDSSADPFTKGTCLSTSGNAITGVVSCSDSHGVKILDTAQTQDGCPFNTDKYFIEKPSDPTPGLVVCLSTSS